MYGLDSRDRFKCFVNRDGLDEAIKSIFSISNISESIDKGLPYAILVAGGLKKEGENFDYRFSDNEKSAFDDFYYHDLFSFLNDNLNNKSGHLIWRKRPILQKIDEDKFIIYSRLVIID